MLVKTLLPFVLTALAAVNARPVLPTEKTPADAKDAVLAAAPGGHGHGNPLEGVHPPTGQQRRDLPPAKPDVVKVLPVGQAPVPHDRMPKKAPLPASAPSTPLDGTAPQVASRDVVAKPAALNEVDPMSERNPALSLAHGAAQKAQAAAIEHAPVGTRDVKTPVPVPAHAPSPPAPVPAPAAPAPAAKAPVPAPQAPASAPAPPASPAAPAPIAAVKNVAQDKISSNEEPEEEQAEPEEQGEQDQDEQEGSDSDSDSDADADSEEASKHRQEMPVPRPPTPVKDVHPPVEENNLPVRDGMPPKAPSAVTDKTQMLPAAIPRPVRRQVKAPEVKRPAPIPQGVPPVSPNGETPKVTPPQEPTPTVSASEVQPTTVTEKVSDAPSAPTDA